MIQLKYIITDIFEGLLKYTDHEKIDNIFKSLNFDYYLNCGYKTYVESLCEYNLRKGKNTRFKILKRVIMSYKCDTENLLQVCLISFIMELIQSSGVILDDYMDKSILRRNRSCWHRKVLFKVQKIESNIFYRYQ